MWILESAMREYPEKFIKTEDVDIAGRERLGSFGIDISHFSNCYILPGLTDVHVHLREPGFLYKETMKTGTLSAAAGGFTDIFSMPNLDPCPDTVENLEIQLAAIERDACVRVYPYGAITMGERGQELSDMERLADHVIAFTDDGRGVASEEMMREAMKRAKALGKLIVAHCEDENFPKESSESEWKQLERDIRLIRETGCSYHVCHVSTRESIELVRKAKEEGLDITCETAPHYLTISNDQVEDDGRFKMNPPIKGPEDREVLLEAIADGTIDMIATDHAPHSRDEKSRGFADSAFGIVGMETAFPVMYTKLVETGTITADRLIQLMCDGPRKRFGLPGTSIASELSSAAPTFAIWDLDSRYRIDPEGFQSMGRSCPFEGWTVTGRCLLTAVDGKVVWRY
ncbi:MAG TPA: dihydroorotase [Candidatus Copromorpha excrementipullorum]|uniref:Dihydroorotase n=1 Tax=Candidatus Allocopromorpha excrementipullorum TaxID=2840743 RepID=A0A9D1N5V6_9FIRM|nr:dihydroorotase [Candidatus Copromorpha excrementipullorum]